MLFSLVLEWEKNLRICIRRVSPPCVRVGVFSRPLGTRRFSSTSRTRRVFRRCVHAREWPTAALCKTSCRSTCMVSSGVEAHQRESANVLGDCLFEWKLCCIPFHKQISILLVIESRLRQLFNLLIFANFKNQQRASHLIIKRLKFAFV